MIMEQKKNVIELHKRPGRKKGAHSKIQNMTIDDILGFEEEYEARGAEKKTVGLQNEISVEQLVFKKVFEKLIDDYSLSRIFWKKQFFTPKAFEGKYENASIVVVGEYHQNNLLKLQAIAGYGEIRYPMAEHGIVSALSFVQESQNLVEKIKWSVKGRRPQCMAETWPEKCIKSDDIIITLITMLRLVKHARWKTPERAKQLWYNTSEGW